jgi:hypothetical protein
MITVNSTPGTPVITVTDNCGNSVLSTGASGSLTWSTSESTSSVTVTSSGIYTVTATVNGCTSLPGSATASPISIPAAPTISVQNNCGSSDLTTTATGSLLWSTSETTASISVSTTGTYTLNQTVNGCTSLDGTAVANPLSIPTVTFSPLSDVCINTPVFALSGGSPAGGTYSGTGVTVNQFDPSIAGYGTFVITYSYTDANDCSTSSQQDIVVGCADVFEDQIQNLIVYPNPTDGFIIISGLDIDELKIFDVSGKLVLTYFNANHVNEIQLDLVGLADGVYHLEIKSAKLIQQVKILVVK